VMEPRNAATVLKQGSKKTAGGSLGREKRARGASRTSPTPPNLRTAGLGRSQDVQRLTQGRAFPDPPKGVTIRQIGDIRTRKKRREGN